MSDAASPWKVVEDTDVWKPVKEIANTKFPLVGAQPKLVRGHVPISPEEERQFSEQNADPDKIINSLRPFIAGGLGTAAGLAAAPTGPAGVAAVGMGTYALTDMALQHAMRNKPQGLVSESAGYAPGSPESMLANAGESGVTNELFGVATKKVARGVSNAVKELSAPGSVVGNTMRDLGGTFSQIKESLLGKKANISKWIEDVLASSIKAEQIERAGNKGIDLAGVRNFNPNTAFNDIQASLQSANLQSKAESNALGNKAVAVAEQNPHVVMVSSGQTPQAIGLLGANGQPLMTNTPLTIPKIINGPVNTSSAVAVAHKTLDDMAVSAVPLSPKQAELAKISHEVINAAEVTGPDGKVTHLNSISFRDAWNLKQIADKFSEPHAGSVDVNDPVSSKPFYRTLSQALNEDIDNSIPNWKNGAQDAQTAWQQAKAVVGERQALLNAKGDSLADIIDSKQTELPTVSRVINDPKQLQRAISAGELKFPSGNKVVTSTRSDLAGYKIGDMFDKATSADPIASGKMKVNMQSVIDQWNDPAFQDSKKILYSAQQRADYDQLFKNIAITQQKQTMFGSYTKLWAAKAGIMLAPALATSHLTLSGVEHAMISGVGLSGGVLARLMTNPTAARAMGAAASGQPMNISTEAFSRMVARAAVGKTLTLVDNSGAETKGKVDADGRFEPMTSQ